MADRMAEAAQQLVPAVDGTTPEQLQQPVDLGFTVPLWQALWICMFEAVLHNWDGRAGREPGATIPTTWAQRLADSSVEFAPALAHREAVRDAAGRYLLDVGDGVGPITVSALDGEVTVERARKGNADVTIHVTADQYMRLLAGRLPLRAAIDKGEVTIDGDRTRAENLNRLFAGVGG
jgi:hypothetical protein